MNFCTSGDRCCPHAGKPINTVQTKTQALLTISPFVAQRRILPQGSSDQLNAISEWIKDMATANARNIIPFIHLDARPAQLFNQCPIVAAAQSRMCLSCWPKVVLYAEMNLHPAALKPAPAPFRELWRFRNFGHSQHVPIKVSRPFLFAHRHRELDVINRSERHHHHRIA